MSRWEEGDDNPNLSNTLTTRANSDADLYAPMRRRSLLQHGVATRTSWLENDSRQSLPSQSQTADDIQNYYYNPSRPTSSPVAKLEVLGQSAPEPRVETPDDMDYGHIGAFKLGSLRITNGAASPSPSADGPGLEEDYITAGESRRNMQINHRRGLSARSQTLPIPGELAKTPWVARLESPLRQAQEYEDEPLTIDTQLLPVPDPSFALFDFQTTQQLFKSTESPTKSLELANEYMQDIALSPFSFDPSRPNSPSPRLQATSKHTAIEDDLFAAEPETPKLDLTPRSFDSGYGGLSVAAPRGIKGPRELAPEPLAKVDSGYSSNVSLRSFRTSDSSTHAPAVPAKEAPPTPPKEPMSRVASSTYSIATSTNSESTVKSNHALPPLPTEYAPSLNEPLRQAPPVPLKHSNAYGSGKNASAPPLPVKSPEQNYAAAQSRPHVVVHPAHTRQKSMPEVIPAVRPSLTLDDSPYGSDRSGFGSSLNGGSRWRKTIKKEKPRPQSMQPQPAPMFTVQAFGSLSQGNPIPPVSAEASRRLGEREDAFPVNCLPNTIFGRNGLRKTSSRETLGTIMSVGSGYTDMPYREELTFGRLQSALPKTPIPERKPINQRHSYQAPTPARPQPRDRHSMQPISRERSPVPPPHRMSEPSLDIVARAKSMTSRLEADAAAQLLRARNVSDSSWTSAVSDETTVRPMRSFDSIANGNPYASSTANSSRVISWEYPTAHQSQNQIATRPLSMYPGQLQPQMPSHGEESEDDNRRMSWISRERKAKSTPPVSMQTRGNVAQSSLGPHHVISPSRTPPMAEQAPPTRAPPAPPAHFSPPLPQGDGWENAHKEQDPWANQKKLWAERRKSAGEALQTRKSMENTRPSLDQNLRGKSIESTKVRPRPPSAHQNSYLRAQKSLEAVKARQMYDERRPGSARPSIDFQRPQLERNVRSYEGFENSPEPSWNGYGAGRDTEYNHTYGRSSPNKENRHPSPSKEYYEPEPNYFDQESQFQQQDVEQTIHQRNASTSSMLVLDRFTGGLDYGYEPGMGIGGSAGTRNTGNRLNKGDKKRRGCEFDARIGF